MSETRWIVVVWRIVRADGVGKTSGVIRYLPKIVIAITLSGRFGQGNGCSRRCIRLAVASIPVTSSARRPARCGSGAAPSGRSR